MNEVLSPILAVTFGEPWWLVLLAVIVPFCRSPKGRADAPALVFPSMQVLVGTKSPSIARVRGRWQWLRALAVSALVLAIARPQLERAAGDADAKGINIMLVLDASRSMDSRDFMLAGREASRREALEKVIVDFVAERKQDRIGIVAFAERPYLVSPLTLDHSWMLEALREMRTALGTAIGGAVESAVDLLRQMEEGNRLIILVTDGLNTSGPDPLESAQLARRAGIRLYTIGVVAYAEMAGGGVDALMLSRMARLTGGQFFQAADADALHSIYAQIDEIERTQFKQARPRSYHELFPWFALLAIVAIGSEAFRSGGRKVQLP